MFTCGHVDVETEGGVIPVKKWDEKYFHQKFDYEHKLPRTNINISTLHGIEGGFYFKCVLYDCLHYNKCYLIAWLELCFIVGVGQQMVHVEIPLSTEKALSPHALCLLLRFVKHGPCIALRESVQYTFGRKKFLYYHSSNSLHLVLNSSCYVTLVEQTYVQQGSGEVEFSMHFHSNELVSNLAQDQQVDNLVDENQVCIICQKVQKITVTLYASNEVCFVKLLWSCSRQLSEREFYKYILEIDKVCSILQKKTVCKISMTLF